MKKRKLIYVMRKFDFAAVSQVGALLLHYSQTRSFDQIFLLVSSMGFTESLGGELDRLRKAGVQISFYRDAPFLHRKLCFIQARSIAGILRGIVNEGSDTGYIIHTRNVLVAHFTRCALKKIPARHNIPILADFRGTEWAEYLLFTHMNVPFVKELVDAVETRELLLIEREIYETADYVSAVSSEFRKYLEMMWGRRNNVMVNPCLACTDLFRYDTFLRNQARKELEISPDNIVILFSTGGASPWQNIQSITDSFRKLKENHGNLKNALKLLILTPAADKFPTGDEAVTIASAAPHEMNKWLNIADLGVIFRDENVVNYVASPIKVSEYICAGLPLLTNHGVPMAVKWAEDTGYGEIVDDLANLTEDALIRLKQIDREAIASAGSDIYGLPSIASNYEKMYSSLLQSQGSQK